MSKTILLLHFCLCSSFGFASEENSTEFFDYYNDTQNDTMSEEELLESLWELITPKSWTWALIILHSLVFVIGIIGNILVCVAVYRNHTMRTVTNYFIVNLAVADFLVILFCLPPSVVWDVTITWFFGVAMCKIVLYFQIEKLSDAIYSLNWYYAKDKRILKHLVLMIMNAQKPLHLTGANFFIVNRVALLQILRIAFSVSTLLIKTSKDH